MNRNVLVTLWHWSTDPDGKPMALRLYRDGTSNYFYHDELGSQEPQRNNDFFALQEA